MMLVPLMLAALLQTADPSPVPPPQETPETQEIIVVARPHKCSVAIANHVLSDPEFKARMTEWAAGVPVRVGGAQHPRHALPDADHVQAGGSWRDARDVRRTVSGSAPDGPRMIVVPTAQWAHLVCDAVGWAASALFGVALFRWRLRADTERVAARTGPGYFLALAGGAVAGAWLLGSGNTLRMAAPTLSHSVAGALAGAIVGVEAYKLACGIRGSTGTPFVGPFALGIVIGRWGCLFAGLPDGTYGTPTRLPWAVDLGDGIGRHPVEIYESLAMAAFLIVFARGLARREAWAFRRSFYVMAAWYGVQRFAWEFLKPYPTVLGPLNIFHLLCLGLVAYGCLFYRADLRRERAATRDRPVPLLRPDHEPV